MFTTITINKKIGTIAAISLLALLLSTLSACRSEKSDGSPFGVSATLQLGRTATAEEVFAQGSANALDFCRTCHIAGGVADTALGRNFLLSANKNQDYANFRSAWERLGKGVDNNPLLTYNSNASLNHSGGQNWPQGTQSYKNVQTLFNCWNNPASCSESNSGAENIELPLLGSSRATFVWDSYCENKSDSATLPVDPRTLVVSGFNVGKAVHFNAYYENCHKLAPAADQAPKTCGDYRQRAARGKEYLQGTGAEGEMPITLEVFRNLWKVWGLSAKPDEATYIQMVKNRYGLHDATFHNPYPLEGEDFIADNGGSGVLPMGLKAIYNPRSQKTSISVDCYACHSTRLGDSNEPFALGPMEGMGNTDGDLTVLSRDFMAYISQELPDGLNSVAELLSGVLSLNTVRGRNNAVGIFENLISVMDLDSLGFENALLALLRNPPFHPNSVNQDAPNWWNVSHKPRKFFDAGTSIDSTRIDAIGGPGVIAKVAADFSSPGAGYTAKEIRTEIEAHDQDIQAYVETFKSPAYPFGINTTLAEQGAILFHSKNLWALEGNKNRKPPAGGNGSCAGCHGAYSPRYVNDPRYLQDPMFEGIAGYIMPLAEIGTDPNRALELSPHLRAGYATSWWGAPDFANSTFLHPEQKPSFWEFLDDLLVNFGNAVDGPIQRPEGCQWQQEIIGYQAPPLYGIWATAPYLHNGSVPDLYGVLKSSTRPNIWIRQQTTGVMPSEDRGFDMGFKGLDLQKMGVKYTSLSCGGSGVVTTGNACNLFNIFESDLLLDIYKSIADQFYYIGLIDFVAADPLNRQQIEARKIFNTRQINNSNKGHDFTDVLSETERMAIIEYLKTL